MSNPPQSLLLQIGLAGGTRYVNANAGRAKDRQAAAWKVLRCNLWVFLLFSLFLTQKLFLASAIVPLCMFSGISPDHNLENWASEESPCLDCHIKHLSVSSSAMQWGAGLADAPSSDKVT